MVTQRNLFGEVAPIDSFDGDHAFLSNFFPAVVRLDGMEFPTVEHAFQAAKTLDAAARSEIQQAATPGRAKRLGRTVALRPGWDDMRLDVMGALLVQKFAGRDMRERLVATHPAPLIEGNTWGDTFWGVCRGIGENHLGRLLEIIRAHHLAG